MLRRNGPVVKSVESVLRLEGSLWWERFVSCGFFFFLLFLLSSPNLSRRRLDVYHTSTYGVALV